MVLNCLPCLCLVITSSEYIACTIEFILCLDEKIESCREVLVNNGPLVEEFNRGGCLIVCGKRSHAAANTGIFTASL